MPKVAIPNPSTEIIDKGTEIIDGDWYTFLYTLWEYCRCNYQLATGGILYNSTDPASNTSSSATDLVDYVFQRNQLKTNNDCLFYNFKGTYASNANNKQLVLKFGSQTIFDTTALAVNGGAWIFEVEITRTSPTTQNIFVKAFYNDLAKTAFVSGTQDLSTDIDIKLTATAVTTADIELKEFCVELNPIS